MPRGFSAREKEIIRSKLMGVGKTYFEVHGPRKTNVEDLTQAVGISKGAFYLFFESKEELFFDILREAEAEVRQCLLHSIDTPGLAGRERFRAMLRNVVNLWRTDPLFSRVSKEEHEHLLRKLPPETVAAHVQDDIAFAHEFVASWKAAGVQIQREPALVSELIRSLFFVCLHEHEFGAGMGGQVLEVLIEGIVQYVVQIGD